MRFKPSILKEKRRIIHLNVIFLLIGPKTKMKKTFFALVDSLSDIVILVIWGINLNKLDNLQFCILLFVKHQHNAFRIR